MANPRPLRRALRKLARLNRELARRKHGSRHREETRWRLARLHARLACIRRDALHKLTTRLARTAGTVVVETLPIAGDDAESGLEPSGGGYRAR